MQSRLNVLVIGAHPDDAEIQAGGTSLLYALSGHRVGLASLTNGDAGHFRDSGAALAERRAREARCAAQAGGMESIVLDIHDGELEPDLKNRKRLIGLIRSFRPDLIFTHRPGDYHPDHRYASILVQDAVFLVTVPKLYPEWPPLSATPVVMYMSDRFQKPIPFRATVAIGIDSVIERKLEMLHCHESQVYEFMPYSHHRLKEVPEGAEERRAWLKRRWLPESSAEAWRDLLILLYGEERGRGIRFAEAFEASEYGAPLDGPAMERLFSPFFEEGFQQQK